MAARRGSTADCFPLFLGTYFAARFRAAADGEDSDSASTDGTDSDEELKLHGPGSPERPMRRKSSGLAGDAAGGGEVLEIYYR